jgi:hypothetical protein
VSQGWVERHLSIEGFGHSHPQGNGDEYFDKD